MPAGALAAGAAAEPKLRAGAVVAAGAAVLAGPKEKPPKAPLAEAGAELAAGAAAGAAADPKENPPNVGCDAAPGTTQLCFSTLFLCGFICSSVILRQYMTGHFSNARKVVLDMTGL